MMNLTSQENKVFSLVALGLSAKEIADKLYISPLTAQNHIKNIKFKLGLQKSTEMGGVFWCAFFGKSYEELKKQIFASFFLVIFVFGTPLMDDKRELRFRRNLCRNRIENIRERETA